MTVQPVAAQRWILGDSGHGSLRFATPTGRVVAARSNVAAALFRPITRTVLFDHRAFVSPANMVVFRPVGEGRAKPNPTTDHGCGRPGRSATLRLGLPDAPQPLPVLNRRIGPDARLCRNLAEAPGKD